MENSSNTIILPCSHNQSLDNVSCADQNSNVDMTTTWQYRAVDIIECYFLLIIFIFGWINNILAIIIFQTKAYRGKSTGFMLTVLACADIGVVSTSATKSWIYGLTGINIRLHSAIGCKLQVFFTYFCIHMSSWSLTMVTLERVVCVFNPLRVREVFSLKKTIIAFTIVVLFLFGVDSNLFWTMDLYVYEPYGLICDLHLAYPFELFWKAWTIVDSILASFAPFAVILPCNVIIIAFMVRRSDKWQGNTNSPESKISSTTVMLTVNSLAFIFLTAPITVLLAWTAHGDITIDSPNMRFLDSLFYMLFNLNSCLNVVFYSVSSSKFRRALTSLCAREPATKNTKYTCTSNYRNTTTLRRSNITNN